MILIADKTGERADSALARLCPDLTRSAAQKLLDSGAVTCNGKALCYGRHGGAQYHGSFSDDRNCIPCTRRI